MALVAAVALTMGQSEAKPKDALAIIFGIVGAYLVLLFFLQLRDVSKAEGADARALELAPGEIENPATRKGVKTGDWLLDLWLAERLAEALGR